MCEMVEQTACMTTEVPVQLTVDTPYMVGPVHCYTMEVGGELVLFDTGPPTPTGEKFLRENIDLGRLNHVIVTHCHVDHYGLTSWLEQKSDATLYLPYRDVQKIRRYEDRLSELYSLFAAMGFNNDYIETLKESFYRGVLFPPLPENYLIAETDIPERLGIRTMGCAGHSQSDLVYYGENWDITGDTLPRGIFQSPLLDVDTELGGRFNNYDAYCASIVKLAGLEGKRILPGHRKTIESIGATILFYVSKTLDRVIQLKPYIKGNTIAGMVDGVFGEEMKDPCDIYLMDNQIVFMNDLLQEPDLLRQALEQMGLFDRVEERFFNACR